ncbi:DUF4214 domain-containing protein [Paraburkholderia fungorum]|uniref:beta strand repeat-containing protein n=1 Tax=Paraburkholderia fungorum TaxID=134537 RepID=UPI0038BD912D
MTVSVDQTIAACYVAFFGRSPDQQGLQFWEAAAKNSGQSGMALAEALASGFANNPSFATTYQGMGNAAFVSAIYQNIGGNTGDTAGQAYWLNLLNNGESRAQVVADFVYGVLNMTAASINAEVAAGTITQTEANAALTRQQYLTNKANVGLAFTQALGAGSNLAASTDQTSLASLQQDPAYQASQAILNTVTADPASATAAEAFLNNSPTTSSILATYGNGGTGVVGSTFTLTTGVDPIALTGNNNVVNGIIGNSSTGSATAVSTFTALDSITAASGSTGNVLNIADTGGTSLIGSAIPAGVTVSGVQTVNWTSAVNTAADNFSNWTGLTQLNVKEVGGANGLTAAGTTAVSLTDSALDSATAMTAVVGGGNNIIVNGGSNVSVTANGVLGGTTAASTTVSTAANAGAANTAGQINVGQAVAATGTVTVTENVAAGAFTTATTVNADAINVKGGTTVSVTANLSGQAGFETVNGGTINVVGTSATTTVTVNQTADATAAATVAASAGSAGNATAIVAVPGVTGVPASAATPYAAGKAAVAGVSDGIVVVQDANFGTTNANTITNVTLANYAGLAGATFNSTTPTASEINSNALTNLSLSGTAGALVITNATATPVPTTGVATASANSTLNLTLNGLTAANNNVLATTAAPGNDTITDTNNEIKTLNVVTATANSTITQIVDTGLTTLNVSGTNVLKLGSVNTNSANTTSSLTTLNVSGAAGFNDGATTGTGGLAALGTALTITDTSSGTFTAALNALTQSFTGSTGQDVITINDQTQAGTFKAIAAGSATNNELVLDGGVFGLTTAQAAKLTGFQTIGVTNTVTSTGTINLTNLDANASTLDFIGKNVAAVATATAPNTGTAGNVSFINAAAGGAISIDASWTNGNGSVSNAIGTAGTASTAGNAAISVNYAGASGSTSSTTVNIGAATNATAIVTDILNLADANGNGIGTLNIVSNDSGYSPMSTANTAAVNTGNIIGKLGDSGLATLTVSGTGALSINTLDETAGNATAVGGTATATPSNTFTLNNTDTGVGGVTISSFTDNSLGNLSFTGTGNSTITGLHDSGATILNISNTGSGLASIGTLDSATGTASSLSSLTLSGNIALGQGGTTLAETTLGLQDSVTTGVTVTGGSDNAHVTLNLAGAGVSGTTPYTDSITLGNGNNYVIDASSAGTVKVTVGTGSNLIDVSSSVLNGTTAVTTNEASTYAASVTLGAHSAATGVDSIVVGGVAANTATAAQTVITGAGAGDIISFRGDSATVAGVTTFALTTATQATATQQAAFTAQTSLANAVTQAETFIGANAHTAIGFQYGNNTYVVEHVAATAGFAAGDAVIELMGQHTVGSVNAGHLVLAS